MTKKGIKRVSWVMAIIAVLLAAALVICALSDGFKNWDRFKIHKEEEKKEEDVGAGVVVTPGEGGSDRIALAVSTKVMQTAAGPETTQRITATLKNLPEDTKLDYAIAWKNGASEWATGKSVGDYLTATPTADGALTVDVKCSQAFGEQGILTASVRGTPSITATATLDYRQRFAGVSGKLVYTNTDGSKNLTWDLNASQATVDFVKANTLDEFGTLYGTSDTTAFTVTTQLAETYTLAAEVGEVKVEVSPSEAYKTAMTAAGGTIATELGSYAQLGTGSGASAEIKFSVKDLLMIPSSGLDFLSFKTKLKAAGSVPMLTVKVTSTVNGDANTEEFSVLFNGDSISASAPEITFDKNLVF